jgi:NAD(P)H-dependent flavin oxidoreductase YrpB (nitropropane dioxygenase family)
VNIMGVVGHFKEFVKAAAEEGVDLIIQGAGFREDIFEIADKYDIPVLAVASSVKVAEKAEKSGAAAVIIEGCDAGGHLGFPEGHKFRKTIDIVKEAAESIKIPFIAAGGIFNGQDIVECFKLEPRACKWQQDLWPQTNVMRI